MQYEKIGYPLQGIKLMQVHSSSRTIGMLVLEQDQTLLQPLRLCEGDLIVQVNGQSIKPGKRSGPESNLTQLAHLRVQRDKDVLDLTLTDAG